MGKVGTPSRGPDGRTAHLGTVSPLPPQSHPLALTSGPASWVGGGVELWGWEKLRRMVLACVFQTEFGDVWTGLPLGRDPRGGRGGCLHFQPSRSFHPCLGSPHTSEQTLSLPPLHIPREPGAWIPPCTTKPFGTAPSLPLAIAHPAILERALKHLLNVRVTTISGANPQFLLTHPSRILGSRYG